jgi:hypothetical protein
MVKQEDKMQNLVTAHVMRQAAENVTRAIARDKGIKVRFSAGKDGRACFNLRSKILEIPYYGENLTVEQVRLSNGLVDHETGHAIYTNKELPSDDKAIAGMANAIEDIRIENELSSRYLGCAQNIEFIRRYFNRKLAEQWKTMKLFPRITFAVQMLLAPDPELNPVVLADPQMLAAFAAMGGEDWICDAFVKCEDTKAIIDLSAELVKRLRDACTGEACDGDGIPPDPKKKPEPKDEKSDKGDGKGKGKDKGSDDDGPDDDGPDDDGPDDDGPDDDGPDDDGPDDDGPDDDGKDEDGKDDDGPDEDGPDDDGPDDDGPDDDGKDDDGPDEDGPDDDGKDDDGPDEDGPDDKDAEELSKVLKLILRLLG